MHILLFVRVHYIVIIYYILTWLVTANDVWMDLTLLMRKISTNKKMLENLRVLIIRTLLIL